MASNSHSVSLIFFTGITLGLAFQLTFAQPLPPKRIISTVPSVTEILFAIGAGPQVVGIGNFDRIPKEHLSGGKIARVGGLLDPNIEQIFTLRPDLVVLYESQADVHQQLEQAKIPVLLYKHGDLNDLSETIRNLGFHTGRLSEARTLAGQIKSKLETIRRRIKDLPRPRTLLVFSREPQSMRNIYASGGVGFLHDMLEIAGGDNVFANIDSERVAQVSSESILVSAPDVIIEILYGSMVSKVDIETEQSTWNKLSPLPAVQNTRIYFVSGNRFVTPGPGVADATEELARILHPEAF